MTSSPSLLLLFLTLVLSFGTAQGQSLPPNTKVWRDVEYVPGGGHTRSLDLYVPEKKGDAKLPLVIWIHGGAWRGGDKAENKALWLLKEGFASASINYRPSPEARFPAQIEDCKAAIRFLRSKAGEYGFDADHIGVWGSSAGGHLAALLGVSGGVKELEGNPENPAISSRVQAVCDFIGPSDLLTLSAQSDVESTVQHDDPGSNASQLIGGALQENVEKARAASPVVYVTPDDPPFLIVHGDDDHYIPVGQSWELHGTLQKAGVKSTIHVIKGGGHGEHFDAKEVLPWVRDFFNETLKPKH
jgi:acetyl esterase/lipase